MTVSVAIGDEPKGTVTIKDVSRFQKYLPENRDQTLIILKCHLMIEELLREIIDRSVGDPSALEDARLNFNQCRCLAKAFLANRKWDWLWDAIKKLNAVRNALAHNLEPQQIDWKISELTQYVMANNPVNNVSIRNLGDFEQALFRMHFCLSAARNSINK